MHGSRPGKRCTFEQFLEYIWAEGPSPADNVKPHVVNPGPIDPNQPDPRHPNRLPNWLIRPGEDFESVKVITVWQRVLSWKDTATHGGLTGNVRSDLLVDKPIDWYDALGRVGDPIGSAEAHADMNDPRNAQIVQRGKALATLTFDLRFADMERYRIAAVQAAMKEHGIKVEVTPGRTTMGANERPWDTIDAAETIARNEAAHADVAQKLYEAIKSWEEGGEASRGHWAAVVAAQKARVGCACVGAV